MTKGDAWIWIVLIVGAGALLAAPYLRRRPDWINWMIVAGGVVAIVAFLVVFPPR